VALNPTGSASAPHKPKERRTPLQSAAAKVPPKQLALWSDEVTAWASA
jgi:hypothetical protein